MKTETFRDTGIEYPQPRSYLGAAARVECTWRGALMIRLYWTLELQRRSLLAVTQKAAA